MWTFDGAFAECLADMEDALRRAIVQVGDVASIAVLIEISLPDAEASRRRRRCDPAGVGADAWSGCRSGTDCRRRRGCAHLDVEGPLATLVIAYRS